jgi:hypothetical protein
MGLQLSRTQVLHCPECGSTADCTDQSPPKCNLCERVFAGQPCPYCDNIAGSRQDGWWRCPAGHRVGARLCPFPTCRAFGTQQDSGEWMCKHGHPFLPGRCPDCGEWASIGGDGVWRCDLYEHGG